MWAGNPNGMAEVETRCVEEIHESGRGGMFRQCDRKRGFGPDELYCKKHAEQFIEAPIATWYYTSPHGWEVKPEPIYKETSETILIKQGNRLVSTKKRGYYSYWPTRDAATQHLKMRLERQRAELATNERAFDETLKAKDK